MRGRLTRIDGLHLRYALRSGIARVLAATGLLNRINVYPVPDGDTGTNLSMTLGAVDHALARNGSRNAGEVLATAADAAVDGARGNSGAIMADFLQGLADAVSERRRINASELAVAFASADRYARGALDAPQEGTILTAISAVAASLGREARSHRKDLRAILPAAVEVARKAVAETREMLPAMRKAGVEDAGAKGFLLLMEGVVDAALGRPEAVSAAGEAAVAAADGVADVPAEAEAGDLEYRFCTECIVAGAGIDRRKLRDELAALGGSIVLAGSRDKVKVHVHTNDPTEVFALAARYGAVDHQKADDMTRQARARAERDTGTVVVTDTGADLPEEVLDEYGIHTVPLRIHFADRTYLDKLTLTPAGFLREIATGRHHPKTSQPAPGDLRRVYDFLASHYDHVIAISLLGRVSGTLQASRRAARRVGAPGRITVIDSQNVTVGQGLIALYAAECARAGLPVPELVAAVQAAAARTRSYGTVTDLDYATRGGRLPAAIRWLARVLPVQPVLYIGGGGLGLAGIFRRGGDPVAALVRHATGRLRPGGRHRFAVAHAGLPAEAQALADAIARAVPDAAGLYVTEIGAAASAHGGPGTLAVAVQEYVEPRAVSGGSAGAPAPRAAGATLPR
jgi:DegV family protein with EDD domain